MDARRSLQARVLCIEDDDAQATALVAMLELEGCRVDRAASVRTAVQLLDGRSYDAVVADFMLPDGTLHGVLESDLVDRGRLIVVSAVPESAGAAPEAPHFTKPLDVERFRATLRDVLASVP